MLSDRQRAEADVTAPSRISDVEKTYEQVGGVGRFQVFALITVVLGIKSV